MFLLRLFIQNNHTASHLKHSLSLFYTELCGRKSFANEGNKNIFLNCRVQLNFIQKQTNNKKYL